jgi:hypothetical protein
VLAVLVGRHLRELAHRVGELVQREGLADVRRGAGEPSVQAVARGLLRRQHHHRDVRGQRVVLELAQRGQAIHHRQHPVQHDDVGLLGDRHLDAVRGVGRGERLHPLEPEVQLAELQDRRLIVDDEYAGHGRSLL